TASACCATANPPTVRAAVTTAAAKATNPSLRVNMKPSSKNRLCRTQSLYDMLPAACTSGILTSPMNNSAVLALFLTLAVTAATAQQPLDYKGEQPAHAQHGMVDSVHHLASDAGVEILREGGNAVDAAVATGFALAVTHPAAGNIGGGGFLLPRRKNGKSTFIDYREKAPLAATETMYQDAQGNVLPAEDLRSSVIGYRSIATPGSVAGLTYAERKYGKLGLARVMASAIKLARDGFELSEEEARELADEDLAKFPDS